MEKKNYWDKRLEEIAQSVADEQEEILKDIEKLYKQALAQIEADLDSLYFKMLAEGQITPLAIYKYNNRNKSLQQQIEKALYDIGVKEQDLIRATLIDSYIKVATKTNEVIGHTLDPILLDRMAKKAVETPWLDSNFSARLWKNKSKLRERLNRMAIDSLALGKSKDKAVEDLVKTFKIGFNDADRLVRTEIMNIINQAQKEMYMESGYIKYRILAHLDSRTSDKCRNENRKEYYFAEAQTGVNYPPFHPNCRTTVVPILN